MYYLLLVIITLLADVNLHGLKYLKLLNFLSVIFLSPPHTEDMTL